MLWNLKQLFAKYNMALIYEIKPHGLKKLTKEFLDIMQGTKDRREY